MITKPASTKASELQAAQSVEVASRQNHFVFCMSRFEASRTPKNQANLLNACIEMVKVMIVSSGEARFEATERTAKFLAQSLRLSGFTVKQKDKYFFVCV